MATTARPLAERFDAPYLCSIPAASYASYTEAIQRSERVPVKFSRRGVTNAATCAILHRAFNVDRDGDKVANCYGRWEYSYRHGPIYVVYSYGAHWPLLVWVPRMDHWLKNGEKYSATTSQHMSAVKAPEDAIPCTCQMLKSFILGTVKTPREVRAAMDADLVEWNRVQSEFDGGRAR